MSSECRSFAEDGTRDKLPDHSSLVPGGSDCGNAGADAAELADGVNGGKAVAISESFLFAEELFDRVGSGLLHYCVGGDAIPDVPPRDFNALIAPWGAVTTRCSVPVSGKRCKLGPGKTNSGARAAFAEFIHDHSLVKSLAPVP